MYPWTSRGACLSVDDGSTFIDYEIRTTCSHGIERLKNTLTAAFGVYRIFCKCVFFNTRAKREGKHRNRKIIA